MSKLRSSEVNYVQVIVAKFGGEAEMAKAIGVAERTIWYWLRSQKIPQGKWKSIIAAGASLAAPVHPTDFILNLITYSKQQLRKAA